MNVINFNDFNDFNDHNNFNYLNDYNIIKYYKTNTYSIEYENQMMNSEDFINSCNVSNAY